MNYSFTIELPPGRFDPAGFELPESEILGTAKEQYAGLLAMLKKLNDDISHQTRFESFY